MTVALAVLLAPGTAAAFCRTTTVAVPSSHDPARGCFAEGLLVFWRNACVGYSVHRDGSRGVPFDAAQRVIDTAFASWTTATCATSSRPLGVQVSNLGPAECAEVRYDPTGKNQNIIVFRDDRWPYRDAGETLALTTLTLDLESGEIYDADMEINAAGTNLAAEDPVFKDRYDLQSIVTHEAGHFLGLSHAIDAEATMFAHYDSGSTSLRSLSADDVAGACSIYPDTRSRVVSFRPSPACTWCRLPEPGQTEVVEAETCDPTPRRGFRSDCPSPIGQPPGPAATRCSSSPRPSGTCTVPAGITLLLAGFLIARKRAKPAPGARTR